MKNANNSNRTVNAEVQERFKSACYAYYGISRDGYTPIKARIDLLSLLKQEEYVIDTSFELVWEKTYLGPYPSEDFTVTNRLELLEAFKEDEEICKLIENMRTLYKEYKLLH